MFTLSAPHHNHSGMVQRTLPSFWHSRKQGPLNGTKHDAQRGSTTWPRPGGVRAPLTRGVTSARVLDRIGGCLTPAARVHTSRHGGFEGSVRVKFTGPIPQMAITTGSSWLRMTPS